MHPPWPVGVGYLIGGRVAHFEIRALGQSRTPPNFLKTSHDAPISDDYPCTLLGHGSAS
jgi:hypothetical protein